jgi:hypothetical protein
MVRAFESASEGDSSTEIRLGAPGALMIDIPHSCDVVHPSIG